MPLRITLLTGEYPPQPGGVGDYTRRLGKALVVRGHTVSVLTMYVGRMVAYDVATDLPLPLLPQPTHQRNPWGWAAWSAITGALDLLRPDWLHVQYQTGAYNMHPAINLLPWRLRRMAKRPLIAVTFHDLLVPYLFPKAGRLRTYVNQQLARDADVCIVTNGDDRAQFAAFNPTVIPIGSNIAVAPPPGYAPTSWRAALGIDPLTPLIAYFGLLSPTKGVDTLLDALANWPTQPTPVLLLIGGAATAPHDQAYATSIHATIERLQPRFRTIVTGHVDEAAVSAHLLAADVVALPFRDGVSFRRGSLLAALHHGCPIVTTFPTATMAAEGIALIDQTHARCVPPDDPTALAAALADLLQDSAARLRLGSAARQLATHFSWESIAERHEAIYMRCT